MKLSAIDKLYKKFTLEDKSWPVCICGCIAQQHPHDIADVCKDKCKEYRPRRPLTKNQEEMLALQRKRWNKSSGNHL